MAHSTPRSTCTIITGTFLFVVTSTLDDRADRGDRADYVEGVDQVPNRHVIDHKTNGYGDFLCDFFVSRSCLMINGRSADGKNDFTSFNAKGQSVVDYCIAPHDSFNALFYHGK